MSSSTAKVLAKGTFWGILSAFFIKFLGFFYTIMLPRLCPSKVEQGIFFYALSVVAIIAVFSDLGLGPGALGRYVPYYIGRKEYNHAKAVVRISLLAGTAFSLVCAILLIGSAGYLANFFNSPTLVPTIIQVFYIMALYLFFMNFFLIAANFLGGLKILKLSSHMNNIQSLAKLFLTAFFLVFLGPYAVNIAWGFTLSFLVACVFGCFWAYREYRRIPLSEEIVDNRKLLVEMVPFGLVLVLLSSMSTINGYVDRLMLGYLIGGTASLEMIAVYSFAVNLGAVIYLFSGPAVGIFLPVISEAWGRQDHLEIEKASSTLMRWILFLSTPVFITFVVFPREILSILYGPSYGIGAMALVLYSIGIFFSLFSWPVYYGLSAMRKIGISIKILIVGMVINISLNALLIPIYGIDGAAFGSAVSLVMMTGIYLYIRDRVYMRIPCNMYKGILAGFIVLGLLLCLKISLGYSPDFVREFSVSGGADQEIIRKILKAAFLGLLGALTCGLYLFFVIILRALETEDIEVIAGGMRRMGLPGGIIKKTEKMLGKRDIPA
ncbi:MAG: flippase [Candidatus Altiarchaeia archaeon]